MTVTDAPADLTSFRARLAPKIGLPIADIGILPDASHKSSGGYHCGCQDIINIGRWGSAGSSSADYSVRQERDRIGGNVSSAMDIGDGWAAGDPSWIRWNNYVVADLRANPNRIPGLRAANFTPDGSLKRRYDTNNPDQGIIASTDTVTWHTHLEWWRNTVGNREAGFLRMLDLADDAIANRPARAFNSVAPGRKNMQFWSVTAVPAGVTDIVGNAIANLSRVCPTPRGPFAYLYGEIIDPFNDAPKQTITMTWPRFVQLCNAWAPEPLDMAELAQGISEHYPVDAVTKDVIVAALRSDDGHDAFLELMEQDEVKAILAEQVEYAEDR